MVFGVDEYSRGGSTTGDFEACWTSTQANDAPLIASNYALINGCQKRVIVRSGDPIMAILRNDV